MPTYGKNIFSIRFNWTRRKEAINISNSNKIIVITEPIPRTLIILAIEEYKALQKPHRYLPAS